MEISSKYTTIYGRKEERIHFLLTEQGFVLESSEDETLKIHIN